MDNTEILTVCGSLIFKKVTVQCMSEKLTCILVIIGRQKTTSLMQFKI